MIGAYSLPSDDLLAAGTVTITASDEDPDYPITNWAFRKPSKPSKLLTESGWWVFDFGSPANVAAFALIYHNFDANLEVTLEWNSSNSWGAPAGSQAIAIPNATEDGYTLNPWIEVTGSPTYRYWRLVITGTPANSYPLSLGRPYFSGALRDLGDVEAIEQDVRWGVTISEEFNIIEHQTEVGADAGVYPLGDKVRRFAGELALYDTTGASFISLARSAQGRVYPWLLITDIDDANAAEMVRFEDSRWDRTRETINANIFPFRVRTLARGLDWP